MTGFEARPHRRPAAPADAASRRPRHRPVRQLVCCLLALLIATPLLAQASEPVQISGFSPERLDRLDLAMQQQIEDGRYAAITVTILRHGEVVKDARYGFQDLTTRAPLRSDAIFRQASMTKPVIGAALWMLYEEGKWQLDDPVTRFIPEFANLRVATASGSEPIDHPVTMRELLSSSGGWPSATGGSSKSWRAGSRVEPLYEAAALRSGTLEDMIAKLARLPLEFQPGTRYAYGLQHDIMGAVIERISGEPLDRFLQTRIFAPLGMSDTGFGVPPEERSRIVPVYAYDTNADLVLSSRQALLGGAGEAPAFLSGGGGLYSTVHDYTRFIAMLAKGGELDGVRLLAPSTIALMHKNLLAEGVELNFLDDWKYVGQNAGFAIVLDRARASYNSGPWAEGTLFWAGAFGTWCWIDEANDIAVIGMAQLEGAMGGMGGFPTRAPDLRAISRSLTYQALLEQQR